MSKFSSDIENFREWLIKHQNLSVRVASNHISRCKRVERDLELNLGECTNSPEGYIETMRKIGEYAKTFTHNKGSTKNKRLTPTLMEKKRTKSSEYSLRCTLRSAVKYYTLFKHPSQKSFIESTVCYREKVFTKENAK